MDLYDSKKKIKNLANFINPIVKLPLISEDFFTGIIEEKIDCRAIDRKAEELDSSNNNSKHNKSAVDSNTKIIEIDYDYYNSLVDENCDYIARNENNEVLVGQFCLGDVRDKETNYKHDKLLYVLSKLNLTVNEDYEDDHLCLVSINESISINELDRQIKKLNEDNA